MKSVLRRRCHRHQMPPDWVPPAPAWAAQWPADMETLTCAYFGVQGPESRSFERWYQDCLLGLEFAPLRLESACFRDKAGIENRVIIAYWRDSDYRQWWQQTAVSHFWQDPARYTEGVGYWREVFEVPLTHMETLHSSPEVHGAANLATTLEGPIEEHGYPGAMRDRIQASGEGDLVCRGADLPEMTSYRIDDGRRIRIIPPAKMCIIRSGQDWRECSPEEGAFYREEVAPSLREGMDFLSAHPEEARCYSMRLMQNLDASDRLDKQTFGLGYAADILAFEAWAKSHPTHLKIFGKFMNLVEIYGESMKLKLWHEVSVLTGDNAEFEYLMCHGETGLLPYAGQTNR